MSRGTRDNLRGLVRLRSVRERDSRIGLAAALAEERTAAARVDDLTEQLRSVPATTTSDLVSFRARQLHVDALREGLGAARAALESARQLTLMARNRWVEDRSRLAAVESLVARRRAALLEERRRRENRELDEIGADLWRRNQATAGEVAS